MRRECGSLSDRELMTEKRTVNKGKNRKREKEENDNNAIDKDAATKRKRHQE